jgi:hypothetical protein
MRSRAIILALLGGILALPQATWGAAPMPSKKFVHEKHGFLIKTMPDWERTPTQPGERVEVAKFKAKSRGRQFATPSICRFGSSGPTTPGVAGEDEEEQPSYGPPTASGSALSRLEREVNGLRKQMREKPFELGKPKTVKLGKVKGELFDFETTFENPRYKRYAEYYCAGIASKNGEEYLILYRAPCTQARKYRRSFQKSIKSFRFPDEVKASLRPKADEEEEDFPVDAEYVGQAKRNRIKKELIDTWSFIDTPHYIVIYDCDKRLAKTIAKRIERMRAQCFETWFPPKRPIEDVMVVRVCKDHATYNHYGGPPGTGGYWASFRDELVFPDFSRSKKADKSTLGVLHHEGWHQYLHYATGGRPSPIAFNEGMAEFFFCAEPKGRKKMSIGNRHPMRHSVVKTAASTGELFPVAEFLMLTQRQHYSKPSLCYSQGWALFYWLLKGTKNKAYQQIPVKIYDALVEMSWEQAVTHALEGIDTEKLHKDFLKGIKKHL